MLVRRSSNGASSRPEQVQIIVLIEKEVEAVIGAAVITIGVTWIRTFKVGVGEIPCIGIGGHAGHSTDAGRLIDVVISAELVRINSDNPAAVGVPRGIGAVVSRLALVLRKPVRPSYEDIRILIYGDPRPAGVLGSGR